MRHTAERYYSLDVIVQVLQGAWMSVNFVIWRKVPSLRGVKLPKYLHFCLFVPYKTPKQYLFVRGLQIIGYIIEYFGLFRALVESTKEFLLLKDVPLKDLSDALLNFGGQR